MIKKISVWYAVTGGLLIAATMYGLFDSIINPTELVKVNVTKIVSNILMLGFGFFLVTEYFKGKQLEDAGGIISKPVPGTPEDFVDLSLKRSWILSVIALFGILGSVDSWILNNYFAGFSIINIAVISDLVFNVVLLYFVIGVLKGSNKALNYFFYVFTAYSATQIIISISLKNWMSVLITILSFGYFAFAIKARLTRKNYRIAHYVVLPAIAVLLLSSNSYQQKNIEILGKKIDLLEQQFSNDTSILNGKYLLFLQKDNPDAQIIKDIIEAKNKREEKINEIVSNINQLISEYNKLIPSVNQKITVARIQYILHSYTLNKEQGNKVVELMEYVKKVDSKNLTDKQKNDISLMIKEVDEFNAKLTENQFKLDNSNLNFE